MKVLVVEDDPNKALQVSDACTKLSSQNHPAVIDKCETMAEAAQMLATKKYDFIVIDLLLPYLQSGEKSNQAGYELARLIRQKENVNSRSTVVGLSAYPEEVATVRPKFDELGVLIFSYADDGAWEKPFQRILADVWERANEKIDVDFIIVCALEEERDAYEMTRFRTVSESIVDGLNVRFVRHAQDEAILGAIVRLSNMGLVVATRETACALNAFNTRLVAMSGVCAGFSAQTELGELIVASPAWEYQAGKWSESGFEIGAIQVGLRPSTRAKIDQAIGSEEFLQYLEKELPRDITRPSKPVSVKLGPFVTGSAVIADKSRLTHIEQQHRKVAGLDMEIFGLYFSANEASDPIEHFFAVKCVVDFADGNKKDEFHRFGSVVSARATECLIIRLLSR